MRTHTHSTRIAPYWRGRQRGAAIIEFALVAMIFFTLLIGVMEFGRWLFTLNAAGEATRLAYMTDEAAEGRDSFLEKRDPDWSSFPWHY